MLAHLTLLTYQSTMKSINCFSTIEGKDSVMRKKIRSMVIATLILILGCMMPVSALAATHQTKTNYYYSLMNGQKDGIYSMQLKRNKLVIKGTFAKSTSSSKVTDKYFNGDTMKYKRITFTLAKNCKFYSTGGTDGKVSYPSATFKECYVTQPDLGLGFKVKVKKGKVLAIYTES